jgi:hypothetical protein
MSPYEDDRRWSDRFIGRLKQIAGYYLLEPASEEEDAKRNTDLIVLTMAAKRIGCRVRRSTYLERYANEFTVRCDRPNGCDTELDKILDGWGDYLLYAFCDESEKRLVAWRWIDLCAFRAWFGAELDRTGRLPGALVPNGDGSSRFRAFSVTNLPTRVVLASYGFDV